MEAAHHFLDYIKQAREAEENGEDETAAELYEKAIKQKPLLELPYNRLMVFYRKSKQYSKELKAIERALQVYTDHYENKKKPFKGAGKVAQLSKALLKSITSGKGKVENSYPEPIAKWLKRKEVVELKIKKDK